MCKSGCHNEDCWGDCTISFDYCELEKIDRVKMQQKRIEAYKKTRASLLKDGVISVAAMYDDYIEEADEELDLIDPDEEYRLEREEEQRER